MSDIIIATQLSKYATHVIIGKLSLLVFNKDCVYLPSVSLTNNNLGCIIFDKDDGCLDVMDVWIYLKKIMVRLIT